MNFLENLGHWLFLTSTKKKLIKFQKFEDKYKDTTKAVYIWMPLHKSYTRILNEINILNSRYITLHTLTAYINHKLITIENLAHAKK